MNAAPLSAPAFAELARTSPAPAGLTLLRSALHTRRLLLLKALLVRVHGHRAAIEPGALGRFERSWELLERIERRHPPWSVTSSTTRPPVSGWPPCWPSPPGRASTGYWPASTRSRSPPPCAAAARST
ncbi:hypothetical protein O1L60_26160 [Streptomyces diastatochromogenes]|nr:hypothetical protein [Streptomyces diastatochromogenes]